MASSSGGFWTAGSYDKALPGAYFNIKSAPSTSSSVAIKGIVATTYALPAPAASSATLDGAVAGNKFQTFEKTEYFGNSYEDSLGFTSSDAEAFDLNQIFNYSVTAKLLPTTSWVASIEENQYTTTDVDSDYTLISSSVEALSAVYTYEKVETLVKTEKVVTWTGTAQTASNFIAELYNIDFNTAVLDSLVAFTSAGVATFVAAIVDMREAYGKMVRGVVLQGITDTDTASGRWYINKVIDTLYLKDSNDVVHNAVTMAMICGAMDAGALYNESNTAKTITGISKLTDVNGDDFNFYVTDTLKDYVNAGFFTPSYRDDGVLIVTTDINCLEEDIVLNGMNISKDVFCKNRPSRVIDQIIRDLQLKWKSTYVGKVSNNAKGRRLFKAYCIQYLEKIQDNDGIENFDRDEDIDVLECPDVSKKDAVLLNLCVQPIDSMEKLYGSIIVA